MSTNKTNINEFDGKLYYSNNTISITFHIKYIMLITNVVNTIKCSFNIGKRIPFTFPNDRSPFLQCNL